MRSPAFAAVPGSGQGAAAPLLRAGLSCALLLWAEAPASQALPPGLYELVTETAMPHLEENLRYATTRRTACLDHRRLATAFPILEHAALAGCSLGGERRAGPAVHYRLICEAGRGTTGGAQWHLGARRITGTLEVKLGGKNMTFHQRVTATPLGACAARRE
jgi:hypothetical protein